MKNNHEQVSHWLQQALQSCGYDNVLSETKQYISLALQSLDKVSKKRNRYQKTNEVKVQTQQQIWWEMLKKNAAANFDFNIDIEE